MTKKVNKIRITTNIPKSLHDKLLRYAADKGLFMNDVIEAALESHFNPFDTENHEKHNKMQLGRIINMLIAISNQNNIGLISLEEFVKTFLRHTPILELEDSQSRIAVNARIVDGHEKFMKNMLDSATNMNPNILSRCNIVKYEP